MSLRQALIAAALAAATLAPYFAAAQDQAADELDALFNDAPDMPSVEAKTIDNPEAAALESKGLTWGGELTADARIELPYGDLPPTSLAAWGDVEDRLSYDLGAKLFFDSRPDRNYRVYGSVKADYPFDKAQVFELFTDFNWKERLFFRFGKQTMGWGLSRFYQPADPLSLGVKDPQDPTKELEGPVGIKLSLPLGSNGLYGYVVSKSSFADLTAGSGLEDLGYGLKADLFIPVPRNSVVSDAELSAGWFYQRKLAPKAVLGLSIGVLDVQLFSDQVLSYGADGYRLGSDTEPIPTASMGPMTVQTVGKDSSSIFYSATAGAMYVNSDAHLTLYGEYFFNGQGSKDPNYTKKLGERYAAEQMRNDGGPTRVSQSDLFSYNGMHNTGFSASLSELFGTDKLSASVFWQANWVDLSGMVVPSLSFAPWKRFSLTLGTRCVYGPADGEFILKNSDFGAVASGGLPEAVRFAPYLKIYFGAGKF
jgi:hypothetical protein